MPITEDAKQTIQRFSKYVQELIALLKRFDITNPKGLWRAVRSHEFRKEWNRIWIKVAEEEGGKLTLTTVAALIGAALGGAGIAIAGGAFGISLAMLFAPLGYLLGTEFDSWGLVKKVRAFFAEPGDAPSQDEQLAPDLAEMTDLLAILLSRSDVAEAKAVEMERNVSELESRASTLEKKVSDLEAVVSEFHSALAGLKGYVKHLTWISVGLGVIAAVALLWCFVK